MAYKPGESFMGTLESLSTIKSREKAQAFSEAMGASQEKRAWESLQMSGEMFKGTERRLESNAIINAMLGLYGIEKQDDWERLKASQRAEMMNMLPWLQFGAQLNTSMNEANYKGLKEEFGSPKGAALIESAKQFISTEPPDKIYPNGTTAADSSLALIKKLNSFPQSPDGKKNESVLVNYRGNYSFVNREIRATTNITATTTEGQEIINNVIQNKLKAGLSARKMGMEWEQGEYPNSVSIDAEGGVPSILVLQESLQHILASLKSSGEYGEVVDENGRVYLTGNEVQDAATVAESWLGAKGDKNNLITQTVQQILAKKGIQLDDIPILTPSQHEAASLLSNYRDTHYNLYNRMSPQARADKYGIAGYLQGQTESAQNLYNYIEQEQEAESKKQNIPRGKPPLPKKLPKQGSVEYEETKEGVAKESKPAIQRIFSNTAVRGLLGSKVDDEIIDLVSLDLSEIYLQNAKGNKNAAHTKAVELLNYINGEVETDDEYATYPGSIAPSEAKNLFKLLILPEKNSKGEDTGGFGIFFSSGERKNWTPFLGNP